MDLKKNFKIKPYNQMRLNQSLMTLKVNSLEMQMNKECYKEDKIIIIINKMQCQKIMGT